MQQGLPLGIGAEPEAWSVAEANQRARQVLEGELGLIRVIGEVSGLRRDAAGHSWFGLKDAQAHLAAVLFRRGGAASAPALTEGAEVLVRGRLTVYPPSGRYQLVAQEVAAYGAGALQAKLAALKAALAAEGLFDPARRRRLPRLPGRVAVVTSPVGAVVRDIIHVAFRRLPNASLLVVPTPVQGADCAPAVAAAIERAAAVRAGGACDVIIIARGGGSLNDLWGFNDERVVRAVAGCPVPVVSAIGHETDVTLVDWAADLRAPTPSAAAELVFPRADELGLGLVELGARRRRALRRQLAAARLRLRAQVAELGDGRRPLWLQAQRLREIEQRLQRALGQRLQDRRRRLAARVAALAPLHPSVRLARVRAALAAQTQALAASTRALVRARRHRLLQLTQRASDLSPRATLGRGYAIALDADGGVVRDAQAASPGARLQVVLARGRLDVEVRGPSSA